MPSVAHSRCVRVRVRVRVYRTQTQMKSAKNARGAGTTQSHSQEHALGVVRRLYPHPLHTRPSHASENRIVGNLVVEPDPAFGGGGLRVGTNEWGLTVDQTKFQVGDSTHEPGLPQPNPSERSGFGMCVGL